MMQDSTYIKPEPGSASVTQINQFSNTAVIAVLVALVISIVLSCLSLGLWYNTSSTMQLYEREIRLAQRDAQDAKNQTNTLKEVLEIAGLPKRKDNEQQ